MLHSLSDAAPQFLLKFTPLFINQFLPVPHQFPAHSLSGKYKKQPLSSKIWIENQNIFYKSLKGSKSRGETETVRSQLIFNLGFTADFYATADYNRLLMRYCFDFCLLNAFQIPRLIDFCGIFFNSSEAICFWQPESTRLGYYNDSTCADIGPLETGTLLFEDIERAVWIVVNHKTLRKTNCCSVKR